MISAIFIFNYKGEVLISRLFRADVKRSIADTFRIHVITSPTNRTPVTIVDQYAFCHVKHDNMYIAAVTLANVNVALTFEFCYQLIKLGELNFGGKFNEDSIKSNFVLLYELLDEVMDFGFPQFTDNDTLKQYITSQSVKSDIIPTAQASKVTIQATGATPWRRPNIQYRKNEVFLDIIEEITLLMSSKGVVLSSSVAGTIQMKAYLSGTPECRFGLNEKAASSNMSGQPAGTATVAAAPGPGPAKKLVDISDYQFHQCVKLGRFDTDRTITFVPPDGDFELMRYRANEGLLLPFKLDPVVHFPSQTKVEYKINVKAMFPLKFTAANVVIKIPTPLNTVSVNGLGNFANGHGRARYVAAENCIIWKIPRFTGQMEMVMNAEADLSSVFDKSKPWTRPPISMDFLVPMFTASGVAVRFLKVFEKSGYETVKWVRYHAKSGNYQFRF